MPGVAGGGSVVLHCVVGECQNGGMEGFREFAYEVISALRPVLPAETLDHVRFAIEDDQIHHAVIEAVGGAAKHQVVVPPRILELVHARTADGVSFGWKDARKLKRFLRNVRTDADT
ncbi:MAG: hypothetical protein EOO27_02110 [Comamonadaceae bacterium]|nr:MAG: hypothetical protein EOO27_02110 [Comamonadaceae bacterium]